MLQEKGICYVDNDMYYESEKDVLYRQYNVKSLQL